MFWQGQWALGYDFMEFWHFSDISLFPKIVQQLVRKLVNTIFISNNDASFHLRLKENLVKHQKVSKYYENGKMIVVSRVRKSSVNRKFPQIFQLTISPLPHTMPTPQEQNSVETVKGKVPHQKVQQKKLKF